MKKLALVLLTAFTLSGCYKDPQSMTTEGNGFEVEFLFEKDGTRVYRFRDGGKTHYFTSKGETITSQPNGKNNYQENIQ
jgi:hypothetical protein